MKIERHQVEAERAFWIGMAKKNGWFSEPFFVQVWLDKDGKIDDSVSFEGLERDYFLDRRTNKILEPEIV